MRERIEASMELLKETKLRIYLRASKYISHAALAEFSSGDTEPFKCLFVDNSHFSNYLLSRGNLDRPRVLKRWRMPHSSLPHYIDRHRDEIDLCVAVLPKPIPYAPQEGCTFRTREYVHQVLDLLGPPECLKKMRHRSRQTEQLIRKNGFSQKISQDPRDYDFFFHRIYLPHLLKQHGPYASIDDYEDLRSYFRNGLLLMVMHENRPVAAQLGIAQGDKLILRRIGVLDGDDTYIRNGAQSATYYYMILYAGENGFKKVDFMYSRPFFKDGVYFHKARWGASIQKTEQAENWVHFFIPRLSEKVVRFFQDNPAIIQTPQGPAGLIGHQGGMDIPFEDAGILKKTYYAPGLNHLVLLTAGRPPFQTIPCNADSPS